MEVSVKTIHDVFFPAIVSLYSEEEKKKYFCFFCFINLKKFFNCSMRIFQEE